jgi:hypothetical protein
VNNRIVSFPKSKSKPVKSHPSIFIPLVLFATATCVASKTTRGTYEKTLHHIFIFLIFEE